MTMGAHRNRIAAAGALTAAIAAVVAVAPWSGSAHRLRAAFDAAHNVVPGLQVRIAGRPVGSITSSRVADGHAVLSMKITDDRAWPLRAGTTARLRYGPTAGYAVRYVELRPGPALAPPLPDDALLTPDRTDTPAEVDDLLRILDRRGRAAARDYARTADVALRDQGPRLRGVIGGGARTADALAGVADDLRRSRSALATLVSTAAQATGVLARRTPALQDAVRGLAGTYGEIADRRDATAATLHALPRTLHLTQTTLRRSDPSIARLDALTADLAPAARQLRTTAPVLRTALDEVRTVAPAATTALRRLRRAEPAISRLLGAAPASLTELRDVLVRATPMLACLRPYAPELAGTLSTWAAYPADYDALGHFARAELQVSPSIYNHAPFTPEQFTDLVPDTTYALPRAPGANVGQPWYQPKCGATEAATDPARDAESRP